MSIFTKPSKVFEHLGDSLVSFLKGPLWDFLKPTIQIIESDGGQILITAAENAVAAGFAAGGSNEAKMAAALASFTAEVAAKGLPFIESQARLLIETALQKAKAATAESSNGTAAA